MAGSPQSQWKPKFRSGVSLSIAARSSRFFLLPANVTHFHNVSVELRHKLYLLAIFVAICFVVWLILHF